MLLTYYFFLNHAYLVYRQFRYVNYNLKDYRYSTQLGVILKREYLGLVKDTNDEGIPINTRPALEWDDYYYLDDIGETVADCVKSEFWHVFKLNDESATNRAETDHVFEN